MEIIWPAFALIVAIIAVGASAYSGTPLTMGIALATLLVAAASVYLYISTYPKKRFKEIPLEDFSWWMDAGEPLASLKRLDPKSMAVPSVFLSDLRPVAKNVELLFQRMKLIVWRRDFADLPSGDIMTELDTVRSFLRAMLQRIERKMVLEPEITGYLTDLAGRMKKIAEKLSGYVQTKPEILRPYVDPLARAAERLAKDLETASKNYQDFAKVAFGAG